MEIHTALEQESYFLLGCVGVEKGACAIPAFPDTMGSRSGQIPPMREILPHGIWKAYRIYLKIRWLCLEVSWLGQQAVPQSLPFHQVQRQELPSKLPRTFQEQKSTKSRILLCFVNNRDCVQAETAWKTTALLINKEMVDPRFNVLEVDQEAQWMFCYQQDLQTFSHSDYASHPLQGQ